MSEFLLGAAALIVAFTAVGLLRVLRGPGDADRLLAAQILGTGGVAALLLADGRGTNGAIDVALTLALLAAFAGIAMANAHESMALESDSLEAQQDGGD
jgi:multicomponent Na+:H+ antiporter subunit F